MMVLPLAFTRKLKKTTKIPKPEQLMSWLKFKQHMCQMKVEIITVTSALIIELRDLNPTGAVLKGIF
jgi:hypothetical protein